MEPDLTLIRDIIEPRGPATASAEDPLAAAPGFAITEPAILAGIAAVLIVAVVLWWRRRTAWRRGIQRALNAAGNDAPGARQAAFATAAGLRRRFARSQLDADDPPQDIDAAVWRELVASLDALRYPSTVEPAAMDRLRGAVARL
ncbi:MAG: hypothetical protein KDG50_01275 [Chromatiales bacterium]|nr:hypothetical protein [Chromatiales bacterium]